MTSPANVVTLDRSQPIRFPDLCPRCLGPGGPPVARREEALGRDVYLPYCASCGKRSARYDSKLKLMINTIFAVGTVLTVILFFTLLLSLGLHRRIWQWLEMPRFIRAGLYLGLLVIAAAGGFLAAFLVVGGGLKLLLGIGSALDAQGLVLAADDSAPGAPRVAITCLHVAYAERLRLENPR